MLPAGLRFYPTEGLLSEELLLSYLLKRFESFDHHRVIPVLNIFEHEPCRLPELSRELWHGDAGFFTFSLYQYKRGSRQRRAEPAEEEWKPARRNCTSVGAMVFLCTKTREEAGRGGQSPQRKSGSVEARTTELYVSYRSRSLFAQFSLSLSLSAQFSLSLSLLLSLSLSLSAQFSLSLSMACGINSSISLEDLLQCSGRKCKNAAKISLEDLHQCFGRKRKDAAKSLGVSVSTLKRVCRQHGIKRWPNRIGSNVWKTPDPHERNTSPTCKTSSSHGQTEMENQMVGHLHEPNEHLSDFFDGPVCWNIESSVAGILESPTFHDACAGNYLDMDFTFSSAVREREEARGQQTDQSTLSAPRLERHGPESSHGIVVPRRSDPASTQPMSIISQPMPTMPHMMPPLTPNQHTSFVTVKATYRDDIIKFQLPLTSGIIELKEEVAMRLKLQLDSFNLKYKDEDGDWILISCDKDLRNYLQVFGSLVNPVIRLLVVRISKQMIS